MNIRLFVAIGLLAPCATAVGEDSPYCAFEVKVSTPSGTPRSKVPVLLIQNHQKTFYETVTNANGLARLCVAPLEAVDIVVGFDVCGLVSVRNLHPKWPETKLVFVTFEENPCDHFSVSQSCQVLLHIQDDHGRPMAGARFKPDPMSTDSGSEVSDSLGRLFRLVKRRNKVEGFIRGARGEQARISLICLDDVEIKVLLH
jgi:hypothetical protein